VTRVVGVFVRFVRRFSRPILAASKVFSIKTNVWRVLIAARHDFCHPSPSDAGRYDAGHSKEVLKFNTSDSFTQS
jgi:hypothetical protein